jgi:hypothetical protein
MGFDKIFWGLLFMFDFRIQGFDILPDIVGYFLIYSGLERLILKNEHFREARKYALPLAVISILDIYEIKKPLTDPFDPGAFFFLVIGVIILIINLLMIYHLCSGIAEMARDENNSEIEITATKRWKFYLLCINSHDGLFIFKCGFSFDNGTLVYTYVYCFYCSISAIDGIDETGSPGFLNKSYNLIKEKR